MLSEDEVFGWCAIALVGCFLALLLFGAGGCAAEHGRIEGPPLYVHLCDAMPEADREAWGEAASGLNEGLVDPLLWVGNGEPDGCNTVDVCRGLRNTIASDGCVISLRYEAGAAHAVAASGLLAALEVVR